MSDQIDWESVERSEPFQQLVRSRRAFVVPRTVFFLGWFLGFIILCGYAKDFMAESVYQGLTVGYVLALTQFVMVWWLGLSYLRKADNEFEPLERAAARHALEISSGRPATAEGVPVTYMYDDKPETARILAAGDTITIIADERGIPATFKRHEFMAALDRTAGLAYEKGLA